MFRIDFISLRSDDILVEIHLWPKKETFVYLNCNFCLFSLNLFLVVSKNISNFLSSI